MTSSGTYTFGVDTETVDFMTDAFERAGRDASTISANDMESARRSLNLMIVSDWANKGLNLWAVDQQTINLTAGTAQYTLPVDTVFVIPYQAFTRQTFSGTQTDLIISPISRQEYSSIVNKTDDGPRPTQYYFQRTITPSIFVWPVLQAGGTCDILYWRMRVLQDVGDFNQTLDAPQRWAEAITAGLAKKICEKPLIRGATLTPGDIAAINKAADDAFIAATSEDRERVPVRFTPNVPSLLSGGY